MTDAELLKRCVERDPGAWDVFFRKYQAVVQKSVRYKLRRMNQRYPRKEIRDIVQDIFLRLWEGNRLAGVRKAKALEGWLAMVSINFTSNYCRNKSFIRREKELSLDANIPGSIRGACLKDLVPSRKLNTARQIELSEIRSALEKEIAKLSARQQLVVRFKLFEGKKRREIARIMNIPEGTAAVLLKRAKERLRSGLARELELEKT